MKLSPLIFSLIPCVLALLAPENPAWGMGEYSKLSIPHIKYRGGKFRPRAGSTESLLIQVARRTSVEVNRESLDLELNDPRLFQFPIIFMGGDRAFEPLTHDELKILRNYLNYGGFLLIDDSSSKRDSGFDESIRKMIADLFPLTPLQKIRRDHSIFRSFYLINRVAGRVVINHYLEGITIKGRTALVYSANDLAGAWSKNKLGHWNYDMVGGGNRQRKLSIRLGVNIIIYSFTLDYKKDMVHLPIILERLRRYRSK